LEEDKEGNDEGKELWSEQFLSFLGGGAGESHSEAIPAVD